jgi:hypothetical protein
VITEGEREGARRIKKAQIVRVMQSLIGLGDPTANEMIHIELLNVGREFGKKFGYQSKVIMALITMYGEDPSEVLPPIKPKT